MSIDRSSVGDAWRVDKFRHWKMSAPRPLNVDKQIVVCGRGETRFPLEQQGLADEWS